MAKNLAQRVETANAYIAQLRASGVWHGSIVTRIETNRGFYAAEAYHQDFMLGNPNHPYIMQWDAPKVASLHRLFPAQYKRAFTRG